VPAVVAALVAVNLVRLLGRRELLHHRPEALALQAERPETNAHAAHLAPVLAPRVAHDPVATNMLVPAPAHDRYHMVDIIARLGDHAVLVVQNRVCVDAAGIGAARVDLLHHGTPAAD